MCASISNLMSEYIYKYAYRHISLGEKADLVKLI